MSTDTILPQAADSKPTVYVLACRDGSLYTGATLDLPRRLTAHRRGSAKYTRGRLPVSLVACWHPATFAAAKSQEARFKRLRRAEKLALLRGSEAYGCRLHRCSDGACPEPLDSARDKLRRRATRTSPPRRHT